MKKLLIFVLASILLLSLANAWEFDNVKRYNVTSKEVTIINAFDFPILGDDILKAKLLTPQVVWADIGQDVKVAEFSMSLYSDYANLISEIKFYDNKTGKEVTQEFKIKYRIDNGTVKEPVFEMVCKDDGLEKNGTVKYDCKSEKTGEKEVPSYRWEEKTEKDFIKGDVIIGIFTDVKEGDRREWIPKIAGLTIDEWAGFVGATKYIETLGSSETGQIAIGNAGGHCQSECCQTFTMASNVNVSLVGVGVQMAKQDVYSNTTFMNFTLRAVNSSGYPNFTEYQRNDTKLTLPDYPSFIYSNITMDNNFKLVNGTQYSLCIYYPVHNALWRIKATSGYAGGDLFAETNTSPIAKGQDAVLQVWGNEYSEGGGDTEYPVFSSYWDNNGTKNGTGLAIFNVSILSTNGTVFLSINGTNYTANNISASVWNVSINLINKTYPYQWVTWGNGTSKNFNASVVRSYTINNTPIDTTFPTFTNVWDNNGTKVTSGLAIFNVSVANTNGTVLLEINGSNFSANQIGSSEYNYSLTLTSGTYPYQWLSYGSGVYNNFNFTKVYYYTVNATPTPTITVTQSYPANLSNKTTATNNFACNYTATNQNITSVKLTVWNGSNSIAFSNTTTINIQNYNMTWINVNLTEGVFKWRCDGFGGEGVNTTSTNYTLGIDSIKPSVTIGFPTATSYAYNITNMTWIVSDTNLQSCWIGNGSQNITVTCSSNISWAWNATSGNYNWTIWANDSYGNLNTTSVAFSVDTTAPILNIVYPANQSYNITGFGLNYTVSGSNLQSCWYSITPSANVSMTCGVNITGLTANQGSNNWTIWANNTLGLVGTATKSFYVDSIAPTISITAPTNNKLFGVKEVTINYTVSGANNCWWTNNSGSINNTLTCGVNITDNFTEGSSRVIVYANDTVGNKVLSNINFSIDTTAPMLNYSTLSDANNSLVSRNYIFTEVYAGDHNPDTFILILSNSTRGIINTTIYTNYPINLCYQKYPNVSTSCGGLETGSYNYSNNANTTFMKPINFYNGTLNINYTSVNGIGEATNALVNISIPSSCSNYYADKIDVKTEIKSGSNFSVYCYDGSWNRLFNYDWLGVLASAYLNEMSIYWNLAGNITTTFTGLTDGIYYYNVTANDTLGNIATLPTNKVTIKTGDLTVSSSMCNDTSLIFKLYDEENLTAITSDISYNFQLQTINGSIVTYYGSLTDVAGTFYVCINSSYSSNYTVRYGEIQYKQDSYVDRRYYLYNGTVLNNVSQTINLYDLLTALQTSFKLEVETTSLDPYENVYTSLLRWYPASNEYKIVDMGKTDEKGSTVIHVRTEDVDYRIGVYYTNGSLIKLAEPIRMVCLVSPCTYTLRISPEDIDYTSFLNVDYTLTFNETTGIWLFTFSDSTGKTNSMNLTVFRLTGTSMYAVCNQTVTGSSGAASCNTSAYTGTLKAEVSRTASPAVIIASKIVRIGANAFKSTFGLWISLLIAIPIVLYLAVIIPIAAVIGGVIALIPALYFGSINITILGGLALLAGIVAHFLKRIG